MVAYDSRMISLRPISCNPLNRINPKGVRVVDRIRPVLKFRFEKCSKLRSFLLQMLPHHLVVFVKLGYFSTKHTDGNTI